MTDRRRLHIPSFLNTCSGLYVGNATRAVGSWQRCARGCTRAPLSVSCHRVREEELGLSPLCRLVRPNNMQAELDLSAVCLDSTVGRAQEKGDGSRHSAAAGATSAPRSPSWRIERAVPYACE